MDYFPNNTLASFTTRLPEMLDLDGSWEIELAEIQYPHSWYNVRINEVWVLFTDRHHEKHNSGTGASPTILGSTSGQYTYREFTPLVTSATYGAL
jgi:hypothetical protein